MKKMKKIKNLLFTFIICLFGALAFNSVKTQAVTIIGDITANEGDTYYYDYNLSTQRTIEIYAPNNFTPTGSSSQKSISFVMSAPSSGVTYIGYYGGCALTSYTSGVSMTFTCSDRYIGDTGYSSMRYESTFNSTLYLHQISDEWVVDFESINGNNITNYRFISVGNIDYTNGYNAGYNVGYQDGISSTDPYQEGYEAGYNDGYVANNTIPNIYIQSANLIYNTGYFPFQFSITDYINNLNGRLDFTALYNYDFSGAPNQRMTGDIVLNTPISVDDTLKFELVDYDMLTDTNFWIILGNSNYSCNSQDYGTNCVSLSYTDLVNNNYEITPSTLYPNLNITEFNGISLSFRYYNNRLYGLKSIIDTTLTSTEDTQYDIGYNVGYIVGKNEGLLEGNTKAYNLGYEAGLDYQFTNENTITGMMGTLFTMPINMFQTIFNFEFLGVNLAGFFLSLVTLLVVIWLIKKFI